MLIEFTFGNFRSFRDPATLSLIAAEQLDGNADLDAKNVIFSVRPNLNLLRVAAIYGANASGKSNVMRAFREYVRAIGTSANTDYRFEAVPYLLDESSNHEPLTFEATFLQDGRQYRYGFEIGLELIGTKSKDRFNSEWLFDVEGEQERLLFRREGAYVEVANFPEIESALDEERHPQPQSLLLSVAAQIPKNKITKNIVGAIYGKSEHISGLSDSSLRQYTESILGNNGFQSWMQRLLGNAGTGAENFMLQRVDEDKEQKDLRVFYWNNLYTSEGRKLEEVAALPLDGAASEGTRKLFAYSGPIWYTLQNGFTLFVDEIDARFHPLLTRTLIQLFQSKETNPKDAQLVFATHDTNLLDGRLLRRDQIYFVEKERTGASRLYSLAEFIPAPSPDGEDIEQDYLQGKYGAIPFLGGLRRLLHPATDTKTETEVPEGVGTGA